MARRNFGAIRMMMTMGKKLLIGLEVASVLVIGSWAWADTINWTFSTTGNYTVSDATEVEVVDGVAKLIAVDQTDDDNTSTGFGAGTHNETQWDETNNWLELTATGQTNGSGNFISRVMDAGAIAAWNSISWTPERPLYKELPNNKGVESGYPIGNANMTGNVLLMHMNEASGTIIDYSGQGNNGTYNGTLYSQTGKLNTAIGFDGVDDCVSIPNTPDINTGGPYTDRTICLWFEANDVTTRQCLFEEGAAIRGFSIYLLNGDLYVGGWNRNEYYWAGTWHNTPVVTGVWYHVVLKLEGATGAVEPDKFKAYLNGVEFGSGDGGQVYAHTGNIYIGGNGGNTYYHDSGSTGAGQYFNGIIDEVSMFNRALSPTEILDHYKRGSFRLKYQVRSGATNPPTGNFIGPDGTTGTYYSELSNSTTGLPSLSLTNVDNNQYFQYKTYLETDNSSYSPELKSVVIGPTHYPGDNPTVQNNTWQTYDSLSSFAETLGAGNEGSVKYQISSDGTNWYYWNGSNWVVASGYSQTNTALEVNANCGQFDDDIGPGDFYFMAFLHSDSATLQVELDQVDLDYSSKTSVSVSNSTFAFGTNPLNTWLTPQTSVITNNGTVAENFLGRISQLTDGSNTWEIDVSANGADTIRAQWSTTSGMGPWTDISEYNTDFTIATNVAVNGSVNFWFRIQTPTSTSSFNEHSSTLTVTAQEY